MGGDADAKAAHIENHAVVTGQQREVPLAALFVAFLRLGLLSFGGGTDGWVCRDIIERRHWLDDREFLAGVALSRVMPGSGGVNLTVQVGRLLRGGWGAVVAVLGLLAGPLLVVIGLATLYARVAGSPAVHAVLTGVAAAAIGLTLATGLKLAWRSDRSIAPLAVTLATVLAIGVLRWPMVPVILGLAPVSIGLALVRTKRRGGDG
jgi:chromate transporter